jgi:HSP20 family molecular chaperone IbpA
MRNTSFFEKLTGSLRLSDDDLKALNETGDEPATNSLMPQTAAKTTASSSTTSPADDTIIEETDDEFEIPEDAEVETVEEVIEDDSIDSEEVEEYYEEIIEDDSPANHPKELHPTAEEPHNDREPEEEDEEDYPVYTIENETQPEEEAHDFIDFESSPARNNDHRERGMLPIDMYELHHEIIIRTLVPGITPEHLKVSITRDHVSISGTRPAPDGIPDKNYFEREVEWGEFSRMIELPTEVDVEHAEAVEKYGLLVIRLPKIDSMKTQELKVKSV